MDQPIQTLEQYYADQEAFHIKASNVFYNLSLGLSFIAVLYSGYVGFSRLLGG